MVSPWTPRARPVSPRYKPARLNPPTMSGMMNGGAEVATPHPAACPISTTLGTLGHKWTLVLMRDLLFMGHTRFNEFLKANPGLTQRVLSKRLKELRENGYVDRHEDAGVVTYTLTDKGRDTEHILVALAGFGLKHHAAEVFPDGVRRPMAEVMPGYSDPYEA